MSGRAVLVVKAVFILASALLALLYLNGCSGGGGGGTAATGTMKLAITDRQSDDFARVVISIKEVRVVPNGMENAPDNDPGLPVVAQFATPLVVDVMQLQFVQQLLGEVVLPAGTYNQIRLILEPNPNGQGQDPVNYVELESSPGVRIPLKTPSAQQSGLKIPGSLEVLPGVVNAYLVDFDPETAIVARGNGDYNLKPTGIRVVRTATDLAQFGSVAGTVFSAITDWSSATVSVKRRGSVNDAEPVASSKIFSSYTSGRWQSPFAIFVPPNPASVSYKVFVNADGFRLYSSHSANVLQGGATDLGSIELTRNP
jgi:hypothetical protein